MSDKSLALTTMSDVRLAAVAMSASGFFQDAKSEAQAVVKILAGQEMGFGPFASMIGVSIIQGKPSIGANLIAAAIKRSGRYDYRIIRLDDTACEVAFFEGKTEIGRSQFTLEDAKKANLNGKSTWQAYPRNLLFARAISNGARWYCPDIFGGGPVYTPEELGAAVNENGDVIDAPVQNIVSVQNNRAAAILEPQGATLTPENGGTPPVGGKWVQEGQTTPMTTAENAAATLETEIRNLGGQPSKPVMMVSFGSYRCPKTWADALLKAFVPRVNVPHLGNILKQLNLSADAEPAEVVAAVEAHLAAKEDNTFVGHNAQD